ncbi:DNA topoisomerase (ATP-hydrolyzing) subunit B [Spiroplasma platyhelix]|uniref:DNA gyrase subunit B n=1 Tax=Spiroplasma platyhelix PALS-1 TaxID=1276218 RepID=A0A846U9L7_9MOLU|nr:DNA gyrase subunit B [Spiroplasma platyhelix PALS-1]NKE38563.1 DNA topoisomerase (ATP-hydrolyzing) subunit B [Spiroplasma platyhelix PALS-1]UJB28774.1 DNA gyrase subunit B [Spiroplasma platyhelix PALS-1]
MILTAKKNDYNATSIQVLEGLEAVRKRPGMYIGSTSERGLHHLVWEIVDNAIDEALAGFCNKIEVIITKNNEIIVKDNGRGIPVGVHKKTGVSTVETVFTTLHAGGKFDNGSYKVSGGLHGVGASVVNGLSKYLEVIVYTDNKTYFQRFINGGKVEAPLREVGITKETGTEVLFKPDDTIFTETTNFNYQVIKTRLRQLAFLNKGLTIIVSDQRDATEKTETFLYEGGIREYVEFLNDKFEPLKHEIIYGESENQDIVSEIALQYNDGEESQILSFCNNINTPEGGTHEDGFRLALVRELNNYAKEHKMLKSSEESFLPEDVREGLVAIVSIKHPDPQYEGQTKTKLGNSEVRKILSNVTGKILNKFLMENPSEAKIIINKVLLSLSARVAAKKARETVITSRKNPLQFSILPGKLADCSSNNPEKTEVFLVEGDSAGGTAKLGRRREFQAILPLKGKILNVEKAYFAKVFADQEVKNLIISLGCGIGNQFDISKLRYHKVIIMTDADADGAHIRTLLLTFFYRFMRPLLDAGHIYIAKPPLFKFQVGKSIKYAYNEEELEQLKEESPNKNYSIQRYKGLGEMNALQLWETTMDPEHRVVARISVDDAAEADEVFETFMGKSVNSRREFIQENAKYVRDIDV